MVDKKLIEGLRNLSQQRITSNEYFDRERRRIERYEEQKDSKTVTLNREKFLAERAELNADKEEEQIYEGLTDPNRPVFKMDEYDQEALDITLDYLRLLEGNRIAEAHQSAPNAQSWPLGQADGATSRE
jgi:carboxyl-terminal processing protease